MSNTREGLNNIIQAINNIVEPKVGALKYDKTYRAKVMKVIETGVYVVAINGKEYQLSYGGKLSVNDIIRVKAPLNNFSDIYIEAMPGSGGSGGTTNYNDLGNKPVLNTSLSSSQETNNNETIKGTINLHKISKTGSYNDLLNKPSLDFIFNSEKGTAGGVATLDADTKVPSSQIPIAKNNVLGGVKVGRHLNVDLDGTLNVINDGSSSIVSDTLPIGSVVEWYSSYVPENWLICDGSAISREDYADLFTIIGTRFGVGDGSTTFNLPDKRAKFSVGLDNRDTDFNTLGKIGGTKSQSIVHNHVIPEHKHWAGQLKANMNFGNSGSNLVCDFQYGSFSQDYPETNRIIFPNTQLTGHGGERDHHGVSISGQTDAVNLTSNNNTSNTTVNKLPPYFTTIYIIKAKQKTAIVATVTDNLTSDSANDALSAKQGKVLKGYIEDNDTNITEIQQDLINVEDKMIETIKVNSVVQEKVDKAVNITVPDYQAATKENLGLIKVGANLTITEDGTLNALGGTGDITFQALEKIYPVGSIYMSVNNVSPETFLGGTWQTFGAGKMLVSVDSNDTDYNEANKTGGAKIRTLKHTHTVPAHKHWAGTLKSNINFFITGGSLFMDMQYGKTDLSYPETTRYTVTGGSTEAHSGETSDYGISVSGQTSETSLTTNETTMTVDTRSPYITVYMWTRIS